jgi:hypothetical protein
VTPRSAPPRAGARLSTRAAILLVLALTACGARSTNSGEAQGEDGAKPSAESVGDMELAPPDFVTPDTDVTSGVAAPTPAEPRDASVPSSMGDDLEFYVEDGGSSGVPMPITGPGECAVCIDTNGGNCVWAVCEGPCRPRHTAARSCCAGRVCEGLCTPDDRCVCGAVDGGCTDPLPACYPHGTYPYDRWSCGETHQLLPR